ncbi:MAG: SLC13 family permease [Gammaproteobacteria bacterium]|jgi:di/tricarboxylate transporter|nr:MAG: SLC13 family permease [Gammaproteobacteria bacterium]
MGIEAWITIGAIVMVLGLLIFTRHGPDLVMMFGLTLLMVAPWHDVHGWHIGVLSIRDALSGLSNPGLVTVAVLFVVAEGLQQTGAMNFMVQRLLGRPKTIRTAQTRMMLLVAAISAFLNNTPVVAVFIPLINDWARKFHFSPSKLMIPLSYAAILTGMCTLISTASNLVVNGLLMSETGHASVGMFEVAWLGLPIAVLGLVYMLTVGFALLPERKPAISVADDPRQYTVEMIVDPRGPLVGKSIEDAGLRHLPGMYLMEIERNDQIIAAVGPLEKLVAGDRLVFAGIVESIVDLQKIRGLMPATNQVFKLDAPRVVRCLIEAVVSNTCPLVGKSIREGHFRTVYNAAVIAVARNGERINKKIGDIVLRPGDTLLLETTPDFVERQRDNRDFYLVSAVRDSQPLRYERGPYAVAILVTMIVVVQLGWLDILQGALLASGLMLFSRCVTEQEARRSIEWNLLVVIAAAYGIGRAMGVTGAAEHIAQGLISTAGTNPYLALAVVYGVTMVLNELITNTGAAVLVFPIAVATAMKLDVSYMPFVMAVMTAASMSFNTPVGYQTNLMVYGPGGYRFTDYLRVGVPLSLLMWGTTIVLAPIIWPFGEVTGP